MLTLDLHGIRHHDVDRLVENFVLLNQRQLPLVIICGNSVKMIGLVKSVIKRIECEIYEPRFGIIIIRKI